MENSNVLVLYNDSSAEGQQIANYYAGARPGVMLLGIHNVPVAEVVSWDVYLNTLRPQVLGSLTSSIDCIVTTKGLPLRVDNPVQAGDPPKWNRYSSLESELARIDTIDTRLKMGNQDWLMPPEFGGNELTRNPYHKKNEPFSYAAHGIRLTSRLDGFSVTDVYASIDRAQVVVYDAPGQMFLLDDDPDAPASSSDRMTALRDNVLVSQGLAHIYDGTNAFVGDAPGPVIGYVSHGRYSGAPEGYILDSENGLQFDSPDGAVFHTYESFNAYSFVEGGNRYGQGLVAEWIARGGAAGVGHVEEPGAGSPNITDESRFFEMLLNGYTWAEAAWNGTFQLSYVNTVVGDPLMRWHPRLLGDMDISGEVNSDDIGPFILAMTQLDSYVELYGLDPVVMGDMDGSNSFNSDDISLFIGLLPGSPPGGAVPEPTALCLLAMGGLALIRRQR